MSTDKGADMNAITISREQAVAIGRLAERLTDTEAIYLTGDEGRDDSVTANINDEFGGMVGVYEIKNSGKTSATHGPDPTVFAAEIEILDSVMHAAKAAQKIGVGYAAGAHFPDRPGYAAVVIVGDLAEQFRPTLDAISGLARSAHQKAQA